MMESMGLRKRILSSSSSSSTWTRTPAVLFLLVVLIFLVTIQSVNSISPDPCKSMKDYDDDMPDILFDEDEVATSSSSVDDSDAARTELGLTTIKNFRLPANLIPKTYRLITSPVLDEYEGLERLTSPSKVWIQIECVETTSRVILHATNLTLHKELTKVTSLNTTEVVSVTSQIFDVANDFFIMDLDTPLEKGKFYEIFIDFVAPVYTNRRDGIYMTVYPDPANRNQTKYLVSTLFAPTSARRAFFCFDEPRFKARFTLSVGRTANYRTLSNMPRQDSSPIPNLDGWWLDNYEVSVPMSTYLVAFMISKFTNDTKTSSTDSKTVIQSWADSDHIQRGGLAYANDCTEKLIPFFGEYLQFNYSLSKMDSVAMPKISYAGMESWGLIIYMESSLLYFPGKSTEEQRRRTTALISHELAHQWMGNLVSMDWFSDIYLSEGLSTYLQYVGVDKFYPEFESWNNFVSDVFQSALSADSNSFSSHALHQPIEKNQDILTVYDKIAYDKGASVLRMLEHFLTQPVFQAGLRNYVKKFAYQAVHQDALFASFEEEAKKTGKIPANATIKAIMDTWTLQAGYPILRVSHVLEENQLIFEQDKYDPDGLSLTNNTWWIPITITQEKTPNFQDTVPTLWLAENQKTLSVNVTGGEDEWTLVNAASTGFYRTSYDANLTLAIQRQLYVDHTVFPPSARSRLIDDYLSIAFKRYTPVETALNMISYLGKETDFTVWKTVFSHLRYISEMLSEDDGHLTKWINMKLESVFSIIDAESSPLQQEQTKGVVALRRHFLLTWACYFKLPRCLTYSAQLVKQWKETPSVNPIPQSIKGTVYCCVAGGTDFELSDFLLTRFNLEQDTDEQLLLTEGLSCALDMNMIKGKLTDMGKVILGNETDSSSLMELEKQKLKILLKGAIKTSTEGRDVSWKFVRSFFMDAAEAKQLRRASMLGEIVLMLGGYWNTQPERTDLENFINAAGSKLDENNNLTPTVRTFISRSFQASLDKVDKNIDWMERFYERVQGWFAIENYYFPEGFLN